MARAKEEVRKRPIEQYDHKDKSRLNNPPVGLVTPETDKDAGGKHYAYDPHLDPQLVWAGKAKRKDIPGLRLEEVKLPDELASNSEFPSGRAES